MSQRHCYNLKGIGVIISIFKKSSKNVLALFSEHSLRLLVGLFLGVWIARYLGPDDYGKFNYIISFVTLFYPLFSFGADDITVKKFSENPDSAGTVLGSALVLKFISSVFAVLFIYITGKYFIQSSSNVDNELIPVLLVYAICFGTRFFDVIYNYLQSIFRESTAVRIRNVVFILISIAKVVSVLMVLKWTTFVLISGLEIALVSIALIILGFKIDWKSKITVSKEMISSISKVSVFLMFVILFEQGLSRVDQIMVGNMLGAEKLGVYSASAKLINLWIFIPTSIGVGLFPLLVKSYSQNQEDYKRYSSYLYGALFWIALIFSAVTTLFSGLIIEILYGKQYAGAEVVLSILCWQSFFMFYSFARNKIFTIENQQKMALLIMGITFLINVPLNYIMIKKYGMNGAALSSIVSYIVSIVLVSPFSKELRSSFAVFMTSLFRPMEILKGMKGELNAKR